MSTIDIILLVPLIFGAYQGFKKGFLLEVIAILAFVLAIVGGFKLLHIGMDMLNDNFNISGKLLPYIAFVIIFLAIILGINLLGKALKKIIDLTLLGTVDNLAGLIVSVFKWAFGLSIILWLTDSFGVTLPEKWTEDALLYPLILPLAPKVVDQLSGFMPFAHDLFDMIKELLQGDTTS